MPATTDTLLAAGRALAEIAEPGKDLLHFAGEFREIAVTLRSLGSGLDSAYERAEQTHDDRCDAIDRHRLWHFADAREWTRDEVALARDNEMKQARATAARTAQKMLVELSRLIGELECIR